MYTQKQLMTCLLEVVKNSGFNFKQLNDSVVMFYRERSTLPTFATINDNSIVLEIDITDSEKGQPVDKDIVLNILRQYSSWRGSFIDDMGIIKSAYKETGEEIVTLSREIWDASYSDLSYNVLLSLLSFNLLSAILLRDRFAEAINACWDYGTKQTDFKFIRSSIYRNEDFMIMGISDGVVSLLNKITNTVMCGYEGEFFIPLVGKASSFDGPYTKLKMSSEFMSEAGHELIRILNAAIRTTGYVAELQVVTKHQDPVLFNNIYNNEVLSHEGVVPGIGESNVFICIKLKQQKTCQLYDICITSLITSVSVITSEYQERLMMNDTLEMQVVTHRTIQSNVTASDSSAFVMPTTTRS